MAEFLIEVYVSRADPGAVADGAQRSRRAAEELTHEGIPVSFLRSIFVREDETCFFLYEAASPDAAREAAERAGLRIERVSEAVAEPEREGSRQCP